MVKFETMQMAGCPRPAQRLERQLRNQEPGTRGLQPPRDLSKEEMPGQTTQGWAAAPQALGQHLAKALAEEMAKVLHKALVMVMAKALASIIKG